MQTVTVVARETFPYDGITRYRGDQFAVSLEDARILKLAKRVDDVILEIPEDLETSSQDIEPRARRGRRRATVEETTAE